MSQPTMQQRFDEVQRRACEAVGMGEELRIRSTGVWTDNPEAQARNFKARQLAAVVSERAVAALWALRKNDDKSAPTVTDDDFNVFLERLTGVASSLGMSRADCADGILTQAELILAQADEAARQTRQALGD